jgi:hypothetical protein
VVILQGDPQQTVARRVAQLIRMRVWAELVVIDQNTDTVVLRRDVWVTPKS